MKNGLVISCLTLLLAPAARAVDSVCEKWFEQNMKAVQNDCDLTCMTLSTDMKTFRCPEACEELCASSKKIKPVSPGQFLYYPGLTPNERKLVNENPKETIIAFIQKTRAEISSSRNFPSQKFNDEGDAFRHFMWSGLMTKELGTSQAKLYLDAHESDPAQPSAERAMDEFNNKMGQEAAEKLSKRGEWSLRDLEQDGLDSLRDKKLKVIKPGLEVPKEPL